MVLLHALQLLNFSLTKPANHAKRQQFRLNSVALAQMLGHIAVLRAA
jgi:hypothetical protein